LGLEKPGKKPTTTEADLGTLNNCVGKQNSNYLL